MPSERPTTQPHRKPAYRPSQTRRAVCFCENGMNEQEMDAWRRANPGTPLNRTAARWGGV
ncbi:hypothetical protein EV683_12726 [Crenobacter luteus]|nr:hypothetical protein EV683_12726 [Crenobacter luteus]